MTMLPAYSWAPCTAERYPDLQAALFVDQRQFLELCLDAYRDARRAMEPPKGETWVDAQGEVTWSDANGFYEELLHFLSQRLYLRACLTGHAGNQFDDSDEATLLELFEGAAPGAGRSPADKGHGCPAFDSGAGSAALPSIKASGHGHGSDSARPSPAEPRFSAALPEQVAGGSG